MGLPNTEAEFRQYQRALIDMYSNVALFAVGNGAAATAGQVAKAVCTPAGRGVAASVMQLLAQGEKAAGAAVPQSLNSSVPTLASAIVNATRQSTSAANLAGRPTIVRPTWPSGGG